MKNIHSKYVKDTINDIKKDSFPLTTLIVQAILPKLSKEACLRGWFNKNDNFCGVF